MTAMILGPANGPISGLGRYSRTASRPGTTTPIVTAAAAARVMKTGNPLANRSIIRSASRSDAGVRPCLKSLEERPPEAVATVTVVRGR